MSGTKFDDELSGKGVMTKDGREIGKLSDVEIDHEEWSVTAFLVKLDRDLLETFEMKKPMFGTVALPIPVDFIGALGDKLMLEKTLEELVEHAKDLD